MIIEKGNGMAEYGGRCMIMIFLYQIKLSFGQGKFKETGHLALCEPFQYIF